MQFIPLIAATTESAAHSHSIMDALPHLAGMLMVLFTLTVLWGVCALTAKLIQIILPEQKPAVPAKSTPAAKAAATPTVPAVPAGIAPEIIAVIAAAVASTTGSSHRIISIKPMSTSWERAGRQSVLTSHRIR